MREQFSASSERRSPRPNSWLNSALLFTLFLAAGCAPKPQHTSPLPPLGPTVVPVETLFAKTRVALRGATTSFREEGPFTAEVFKKIRANVFHVQFNLDPKGSINGMTGESLWKARIPSPDSYFFITAPHGTITSDNAPTAIIVYRPGMDTAAYTLPVIHTFFNTRGIDQIIFQTTTIDVTGKRIALDDGLSYENNALPQPSTLNMVAGFPKDLFGGEGQRYPLSSDTILMATGFFAPEAITPYGIYQYQIPDVITAFASSGSVVVKYDSNRHEPVAIGHVTAITTTDDRTKYITIVSTLDLSGISQTTTPPKQ